MYNQYNIVKGWVRAAADCVQEVRYGYSVMIQPINQF